MLEVIHDEFNDFWSIANIYFKLIFLFLYMYFLQIQCSLNSFSWS